MLLLYDSKVRLLAITDVGHCGVRAISFLFSFPQNVAVNMYDLFCEILLM